MNAVHEKIYEPHWQDDVFLRDICIALKQKLREPDKTVAARIPSDSVTNLVTAYFNHNYKPSNPRNKLEQEKALDIIIKMVGNHGLQSTMEFFQVLSNDSQRSNIEKRITAEQKATFKDILKTTILPYLEPKFTTEDLHAASTIANSLATLLFGPLHAVAGLASAGKYVRARNQRIKNRDNPENEMLDELLPLLKPMHNVTEEALDIMRVIMPERTFPELAGIDIQANKYQFQK